jgi:hypothetical protein
MNGITINKAQGQTSKSNIKILAIKNKGKDRRKNSKK